MKSHREVIWLLLLLFLSCAVVLSFIALWHHYHPLYLSITPETESAFLKNYTPQQVIKPFTESFGSSFGHSMGSEAGRDSVSHVGEFDSYVVLRPENRVPLMNALRDDVSQQLANSGAEVLGQSGDPGD